METEPVSAVAWKCLEAVQASISACEKAAKWTIALELLLLMPLLRLFANLVPQMQRTSTGIAKL